MSINYTVFKKLNYISSKLSLKYSVTSQKSSYSHIIRDAPCNDGAIVSNAMNYAPGSDRVIVDIRVGYPACYWAITKGVILCNSRCYSACISFHNKGLPPCLLLKKQS